MSFITIVCYTIFCMTVSVLFSQLSVGMTASQLALMFSFAVALGYAYGSFQSAFTHKKMMKKIMEDFANK
jgi:hypothetical protein